MEPDFGGSDRESHNDEDEVANIPAEESDYSSSSKDEGDSDSHDDQTVDVVADNDSDEEGEVRGWSKTGKTSQNVRWRKRDPVIYVAFKGDPFPSPPLEDKTPYQYFKQFFDDDLIDLLADQTNLYSVQSTATSINVNHNEMEMYLGMLVMMSIIKLPQLRMYWGKATRIPAVAYIMPINRFEKIKQFFHCNEDSKKSAKNGQGKLFKVRPVLDSLREKCRQLPEEENHSIDEQIIPTKSRTSLKQYLPNKPNKWGIKVWARCGVSDILYDFEVPVYTGKSNKAQENPELLMGGNVVCRLTQSLPKNVNHKVFFDNFFSSVALMNHLKKDGFWACLKGADRHLLAEKELKKKGRGSSLTT